MFPKTLWTNMDEHRAGSLPPNVCLFVVCLLSVVVCCRVQSLQGVRLPTTFSRLVLTQTYSFQFKTEPDYPLLRNILTEALEELASFPHDRQVGLPGVVKEHFKDGTFLGYFVIFKKLRRGYPSSFGNFVIFKK